MNSCFGCTDRHMGCHSDCEHYKADCVENEKLKAKKRRDRQYDAYVSSVHGGRKSNVAKHRRQTAGMSRFGG